jgi:hypothetical protein
MVYVQVHSGEYNIFDHLPRADFFALQHFQITGFFNNQDSAPF